MNSLMYLGLKTNSNATSLFTGKKAHVAIVHYLSFLADHTYPVDGMCGAWSVGLRVRQVGT